jgi:TIR domain-containing protein
MNGGQSGKRCAIKDLHPEQRVSEELQRAADPAAWFVVLVGLKSRTTPWLEAEWSTALARTWESEDKRLLPIVFGDGQLPPFLRNWVALRVNPDTEASTWTRKVLDVLRSVRSATSAHDAGKAVKNQRRHMELNHAAEALWEDQPARDSVERHPFK